MSTAMDNEVLEAFLVEAGDLLDELGDQLLALEAEPRDAELLNSVFRTFHTVKGGAGFLALRSMVELCHHAEELLNEARHQRVLLEASHVDALLQVLDVAQGMLQALRDGREVPAAPPELLRRLQPQASGDGAAAAASSSAEATPAKAAAAESPLGDAPMDDSEFEALLDSIYGKSGAPGVADAASAAGQRKSRDADTVHRKSVGRTPSAVQRPTGRTPSAVIPRGDNGGQCPPHAQSAGPDERHKHRADTSVRVDTRRVDALVNAVGELVLVRNRLANLTARGAGGEVERAVGHLDRIAGDLQAAALRMRMQPVGKLFQRFPRIVRDLARKLGKEVTLEQRGEDTDLDRTLVESLADPLVHLLRNAVDHGLEDPDTRALAGKPRQGTVTLGAAQEGERIVISIGDDGRGMDPEVLRIKAVEKGMIDAAEASSLAPAECLNLIFRPGFSTRGEISDISGRGVGMDVVKTSVAALGGTIDLQSTPGAGTTIRIGIPLTLAVLRVLMVRVGDRHLALPMANVVEVFELHKTQMRLLDGRAVASHRGRPLPLSDLAAWAGVPPAPGARARGVVVHVGHQQLGLVATEVLGREEVMVKPLGPHLQHLPGIAGVTITGEGRIALVLDLVSLAESAIPTPLRLTA